MGYMHVEYQQTAEVSAGRVHVKIGHGEVDLFIGIDPNRDTGFNDCGQVEGATDDFSASIAHNGTVYANQVAIPFQRITEMGIDPMQLLAVSSSLRHGIPIREGDMQLLVEFACRMQKEGRN